MENSPKISYKKAAAQAASGVDAHVADIMDASIAPETEGPTAQAEFEEALGREIVLQGRRLVEDAIHNTTRNRAFFAEKDIVRSALYMAQKEVPASVLEQPEFDRLINWIVKNRPLVAVGTTGMLTTHEMWTMEHSMLNHSAATDPIYLQPRSLVDEAVARKKGISQEQIDAVHAATLSPNRVTVIEGTAGAGKSFTMEAVKEVYSERGYDVMGTALSWNAAKVLGDSAKLDDEKCVAIEGLTRSWLEARARGSEPFQGPTLIIVDEAGMVGTRHMSIILEETARSRYPVKIVLTGDSLQVIPVDAGNALEAIIEFGQSTRIETIRRQHQMSHRHAVKRLSQKMSGQAINTFLHQECFRWCPNRDMQLNAVVRDYVSYRIAYPDKKALVLALSNNEVLELNHRIRAIYKKIGLIGGQDIRVRTTDGRDTFECGFSVGDDVVLRANDKNMLVYQIDPKTSPVDPTQWTPIRLGVFNRNAGRIVAIKRAEKPVGSYDFTIDVGGDTPGRVVINTQTFKHSEKPGLPMVHNYAGTIYGAQGQTVSHVLLIDSARIDFRLAYVGMSRHKETVAVYLNETELHQRLDSAMGKRQSLASRLKMQASGKQIDDAVVDTGRYNRSEMLRAVALCWCKHSENLTATVYERIRRLGNKAFAQNQEKQAAIEPGSPNEVVVDFIPAFNTPFPLVDVESILKLPDIIDESELIRPSDVEHNKSHYKALEMPVNADQTPLPLSARSAPQRRVHEGVLPTGAPPAPSPRDEDNFISRAAGWLTGRKAAQPTSTAPAPTRRLPDPTSAFEDLEGLAPTPPPAPKKDEADSAGLLSKLNAWLVPKPKVAIPFRAGHDDLCGRVVRPPSDPAHEKACAAEDRPDERPWSIDWTGVPHVAGVVGGPDPAWIAQCRESVWAEGRFGEPRIIARNLRNEVVARYRFDGTCVVGEGYPPVWVNRSGSPATPVYIVAGAKEWLWLRQTMEERWVNEPHNIPHIIWAAKDADMSLIKNSLKSAQKIVIVRSKTDDRQTPWAVGLADILSQRLGVSATISPPVPGPESVPQAPTVPQPTPPPSPAASQPAAQSSAPSRFRRS